jgi:hypothetical protein
MVLDIRARVYCNLGTIISGSMADDYLQGSGLIKTRGEVVIEGTITPKVGSKVTFTYDKDKSYKFPRRLRVLSSFADPFRRTTTVQLGCRLTYLDNRKPPVSNPNSKEENDVPCYVYQKATLALSASYVFEQCLEALELESDAIPLTSKFALEEFDLTPGYIQVMSDLLQSEGYVGYLSPSEKLKFIDLTDDKATGPVIRPEDVIDLGPIGTGDLPGESVLVRYSSLRLKSPEEVTNEDMIKRNWEYEEVWGAPVAVSVSYEDDAGQQQSDSDVFYPYTQTITQYDVYNRKVETRTISTTSSAEINNVWAAAAALKGQSWNIPVARGTREVLRYEQEGTTINVDLDALASQTSAQIKAALAQASLADNGSAANCLDETPDNINVSQQTTYSYISELELAGGINLSTYVTSGGQLLQFSTIANVIESQSTINYETDLASGIVKTLTERSLIRSRSVYGQQEMAAKAALITAENISGSIDGLLNAAKVLGQEGVELRLNTQREYGVQRRPSQAERNNTANVKPEPTEQISEIEWVTGSVESQAVTEFNLPYAPDDAITWTEAGGYVSTPSDAAAKAKRYGTIQNKLLLGNRNGVSLQLAPERLPKRPFDPIYLEANGFTGAYRVNGASWAFDANGIVASVDALFWGAVSAESSVEIKQSWMLLPPGLSSLPEPGAKLSGGIDEDTGADLGVVIAPAAVIEPYKEKVLLEGIGRSSAVITDFPYALDRGTETIAAPTSTSALVALGMSAQVGAFVLTGNDTEAAAAASWTVVTSNGSTFLGGTPSASFTNWSLIQDANVNNGFVQTADFGFNFTIDSQSYSTCYVDSNGYVTFGSGSSVTSPTASNPALRKVLFYPGDRAYQRVATRGGTDAGSGGKFFKIRWEGTESSSGASPGSSDACIELTFFEDLSGTQYIELRHGGMPGASYRIRVANQTTYYVNQTFFDSGNQTRVIQGNATGTSWALITSGGFPTNAYINHSF